MDTEKKGFPGEPIGKGDYNISAFCPARSGGAWNGVIKNLRKFFNFVDYVGI